MATVDTQGKFHIALNGIGLILEGAPDSPAYEQKQAPIYGARFAQGDRDYEDFSFWWFWAQTDWSGGVKNQSIWADDAKFFESEGVNVIEKAGSVILNWRQLTSSTVAKTVTFNDWGFVGSKFVLVGRNTTDNKMRMIDVSNGDTLWEDSNVSGSDNILCTGSFDDSLLYLGCATVGSGASMLKTTTGGSASDVGTLSASNGVYGIIAHKDTEKLYLFMRDGGVTEHPRGTTTFTVKKTAHPLGNDYTAFSWGTAVGRSIDIIGDRIYFMLSDSNSTRSQLWVYDIGADAYVHINTFEAGSKPSLIIAFNDDLYLFESNNLTNNVRIWKYDVSASSMSLIHTIGRSGDTMSLIGGSVIKDADNIYFVVNDGSNDYQIWSIDTLDNISSGITPPSSYATTIDFLAINGLGRIAVVKNGASGTNKVDSYDTTPPNDRGTTGYIITSIFDGNIPAIDKLFYDITIGFDQLVSGNKIEVLYSTDEGANFTSIDNVNFTDDGGTIINMTFLFGIAIVAKKIMLKFIFTGTGNDTTPSLNDFSVRYIPVPDYKKLWNLNVNCGDETLRIDGRPVETTGRELRGSLEKSWWTKEILDYQDLDYATTAVNDGSGLTADLDSGTVDASTSGTTLVATASIFSSGDVGKVIFNKTTKESTTITAYTSGTTVTVGDAIFSTNDNFTFSTITVDDTDLFPEQGRLLIEEEELTYTGKTRTTFTGVVRGARGTIAKTHADNVVVNNVYKVLITDIVERVPVILEGKRLEYSFGISLREA